MSAGGMGLGLNVEHSKLRVGHMIVFPSIINSPGVLSDSLRCGLAHGSLQPCRPNRQRLVGLKSGSLTFAEMV